MKRLLFVHVVDFHRPGHRLVHFNNYNHVNLHRFDHTRCPHLQGKDVMTFVPFGYGYRKCPGYHFAYVEVSIFLTMLLQKFTFKLVGEAKEVGKVHGIVTTPETPLKFFVSLTEQ